MASKQDDRLLVPEREIALMSMDFAGAYDPLSIQLLFSIRALGRRINDAATTWLAPFGLSATKYNYLAVLHANRETGMSPTQIGAVVHTVSATVTSMLNALEREKLVKRGTNRLDGRSAIVRLTSRGERLFIAAASAHHGHVSAIIDEFGRPAATALLDDVLRLGGVIATHAGRLDIATSAK